MSVSAVQKQMRGLADREKARVLQRFFKTGPGEYGAGDVFLGIRVPDVRRVAKQHAAIPLGGVARLLESRVHEERLLALLILVRKYATGDDSQRKAIYDFYLSHTPRINNWDLVDLSAEKIVGPFLETRSKRPLHRLARSRNLWERRIAILSTFHYIKQRHFTETLEIAGLLLADSEDLIHKAVGWMLREVGKRDRRAEKAFLKRHCKTMPRTMLRYAIERFPGPLRQRYLKGISCRG